MNLALKQQPVSNPFQGSRITWLHYYFDYDSQPDVSFFLALELPVPSVITYGTRGFRYAWAIDGYFGKRDGKVYIQDTRDRLAAIFTYNKIKHQDVGFTKPVINENSRIFEKVYRLKDFKIDDYRKSKAKPKWKQELDILLYSNIGKSLIDPLFEATRYEIYALKHENRLNYENVHMILETANAVVFNHKYNHSDIRMKANNMYYWTLKVYTGSSADRKEYQRLFMRKKRLNERNGEERSREEAAEMARDCHSDQTKAKVVSAMAMLKNNKKLYKKNGDINVSLVAKIAGVNRRSAKKYLL